MTMQDQEQIKAKEYAEAMHYIANAKSSLKTAGKDDRYYKSQKYVRTACGTAYSGVLVALDALFEIKEVPPPKKDERKSVKYYTDNLTKIDKKMKTTFRTAYNVLHLNGYYEGETSVKAIQSGFEAAAWLIDLIKPRQGAI